MKTKLLVITGPTATGKTDVALKLAKKFNGELISADSRQVYIGLDIGTGKLPSNNQVSKASLRVREPSLRVSKASLRVKIKKGKGFWEIEGIKIWAYDLISYQQQYTVADYIEDARRYIDDIVARDKLPILVGGTYFYIKSLLNGLSNLSKPTDVKLRERLERYSLAQLQQELKQLSSQKWQKLNESDKQNPRRLLRVIELVYMNPYADNNKKWMGLKNNFDILKIGLIAPREILYQNADTRVLTRIDQGMIEETKKLHKQGLTFKRMKKLGLEYQVLADYLQGRIIKLIGDGFVKILQGKIHGFVRRQLTWFKKDPEIVWFDITNKKVIKKLENYVYKWYYSEMKGQRGRNEL